MMYRNKDQKFALWGKRLVWDGPEGYNPELVAQQKVEQLEKSIDNSTDIAAELKKIEEALVLPQKATAQDRIKRESAIKKVREAGKRLEQVKEDVVLKAKLTADLAKIDLAKIDFREASDRLTTIEREAEGFHDDAKKSQIGLESKRNAVDAKAKQYYDGLTADITGKTGRELYLAQMAKMAELQQAMVEKFPGIRPHQTVVGYVDAYNTKIAEYMASLASAPLKDEVIPEGLTADEKKALERFGWSKTNFDAATEAGHKAGALEHMNMVLAEQEARRVWQMLPAVPGDLKKTWRGEGGAITDSLGEAPEDWNPNGENYKNYNAAVEKFNAAKKLTGTGGVEGRVQYGEAARLFKEAAADFRRVLDAYRGEVVENKETEATDNKKIEEFNGLVDGIAVAASKIRNMKLYEKIASELLAKVKKDVLPESLDAKITLAKQIKTQIETKVREYNDAVAKVRAAIVAAVGRNVKEKYYLNSTKAKVIKDYLSDYRLRSSVPAEYRDMIFTSSLRVSGNMKIDDQWYRFSASYNGEEPAVKELNPTTYIPSSRVTIDFGLNNAVVTEGTLGQIKAVKLPLKIDRVDPTDVRDGVQGQS